MKSLVTDIKLLSRNNVQELILTIKDNPIDASKKFQELKEILDKGKVLICEIKQFREKRSIDSNAYLWVLCQKIAEVILTTKELVYQKVIRDVGQFEIMPIKNEAVDRWIKVWNSKGLGWFAEIMEDSKLPGYKKIISYYGSSVYDQREMCVITNEIITQCKDLDIETKTPKELAEMNSKWGVDK